MKWELLSLECLSEFRMDQHLLEQESSSQRQGTLAHLASCERCQQEFSWMKQERTVFLTSREALPTSLQDAMSHSLPSEVTSDERAWSWTHWLSWATLATCSLAAFWMTPWKHFLSTTPVTTIYRGEPVPVFLVGLKRGKTVRQIRSGEYVRSGDRIRLAYQWKTNKTGFVYVLHRDQNRKLSALYPENKMQVSLPVKRDEEVFFPGSLEFDRTAHGYEEIWACFSLKPLPYDSVMRSIPRTHGLVHWESKKVGTCKHLILFQFQRGQP